MGTLYLQHPPLRDTSSSHCTEPSNLSPGNENGVLKILMEEFPAHSTSHHGETHIMSLPLELRLEIFSHSSAFTLLNLSQTSSRFRFEINAYPTIVRSSFGYCQSADWRVGISVKSAVYPQIADPHLSIRNLYRLESFEETILFRRLCASDQGEPDCAMGHSLNDDCCADVTHIFYDGYYEVEKDLFLGAGWWAIDCFCNSGGSLFQVCDARVGQLVFT
ncbi:hypothetical protein BJ508DRAFT_363926 [Ascobolus immersus RN42]|uniref:F-box domain-containing protein n=1 Tax=Ascobolus immersus RN42 TaxID=1160509 RepID=A0A3N4I1Y8_ASCIM|nr:hypothetical protein BJ508DRAFT_363926 [Ascobolus immersus RN42]